MNDEIRLVVHNVHTTLQGNYSKELVGETLTCYPTPKYFKKKSCYAYKPSIPRIRLLRTNKEKVDYFPTGLLSRVAQIIPNPTIHH